MLFHFPRVERNACFSFFQFCSFLAAVQYCFSHVAVQLEFEFSPSTEKREYCYYWFVLIKICAYIYYIEWIYISIQSIYQVSLSILVRMPFFSCFSLIKGKSRFSLYLLFNMRSTRFFVLLFLSCNISQSAFSLYLPYYVCIILSRLPKISFSYPIGWLSCWYSDYMRIGCDVDCIRCLY